MKLHNGKNIALVDELEMGLEPHRIRGIIYRLKKTQQQVFTTTHSPVVIRELDVSENGLYVCRRDAVGNVVVESMAIVPDIQGAVRTNAEAFLGSRIVACEGLTEIGCLRAYDVSKFDADNPPIWSLATAYFNAGGGSKIKAACSQLSRLGYRLAVVCDNDADDQLSATDIAELQALGAHVCQWSDGNSTEHQLFADLLWVHVPELLKKICENHDTLELKTVVNSIQKEARLADQALGPDPTAWAENALLRKVIGDLAHKGKWIKRMDYARKAFQFSLSKLSDTSIIKTNLASLWSWIQCND